MNRTFAIGKRVAPWFGAVVILAILFLWALFRTGPGHRAVEWFVARATDDEISISGLSGALPDSIYAERVRIRDRDGIWLEIQDISISWAAIQVFWNKATIQRIAAGRVVVRRWPKLNANESETDFQLKIESLSAPHILLADSVVGEQTELAARGALHYASKENFGADFIVNRSASDDTLLIKGGVRDGVANGRIALREGTDGIFARLIGFPGLAPVNASAVAAGDRNSNRITVSMTAGNLTVRGSGTVSLASRQATVGFHAAAPAIELNNAVGWSSLAADGQFHGNFNAPQLRAVLQVSDIKYDGYQAASFKADLTGANGRIEGSARLERLRIANIVFAPISDAPFLATFQANVAASNRPVQVSLRHPLIHIDGSAETRQTQHALLRVNIPSLSPFRTVLGEDITGSAVGEMDVLLDSRQTAVTLNGKINTSGNSLVARLVGHTNVSAKAVLSGRDIVNSQLTVDGTGLTAKIAGTMLSNALNFRGAVAVKDFGRIQPAFRGKAELTGQITGFISNAILAVRGDADVALERARLERVHVSLSAVGLPTPRSGLMRVAGKFGGAGLSLNATLSGTNRGKNLKVNGDWKSLKVRGEISLPAKGPISGRASVDLKSVRDLVPVIGTPVNGVFHMTARLGQTNGQMAAFTDARGTDLSIGKTNVRLARVNGVVTDPFGRLTGSFGFQLSDLNALGWKGNGSGKISGDARLINVEGIANLADAAGRPAKLALNANYNVSDNKLSVQHLTADWGGETLTLSSAAQIDLSNGFTVNSANFAGGGGAITISGSISPTLAIVASAEDIRAEAISLLLPQVSISGTLSAKGRLTGTLANSGGSFELRGRNLRHRVYAVSATSAANLEIRAVLNGTAATIEGTLTSSRLANLRVNGELPLQTDRKLDLRLTGTADLALLEPFLAAGGQRLSGKLEINSSIAGTLTAPQMRGAASLANGEFQDFARGIRLQNIDASLKADREGIHLLSISAKAGSGTINGSGTVDIWTKDLPINLVLRADKARPISSDLLTAVLSGEVRIGGELRGATSVHGTLTVSGAQVTLPQSFPPEVQTLNVRQRDNSSNPNPRGPRSIMMDVAIRSAGAVILRGRGIDADLNGGIRLTGPTHDTRIEGGFEMRRGTLDVAGQTLNFTTGKISFDGAGLRNRLDPVLDFKASRTSGGITAILSVSGYASRPHIALTSTPPVPQDEVVARLLFQQSARQIGALQLAQGAQALASLAGVGSGFSPLAALRSNLGLDRLSVGGDGSSENRAAVEVGKYVFRDVYLGARQGVSGQTQAQVQLDLTKNLKAQATVTTGPNATATQGAAARESNGSVGLSYQFDY